MRISDCSSDVCSSDLLNCPSLSYGSFPNFALSALSLETMPTTAVACRTCCCQSSSNCPRVFRRLIYDFALSLSHHPSKPLAGFNVPQGSTRRKFLIMRSEEHTSELQSLMRISYAVFCLKQNTQSIPSQSNILTLY